MPGKSLIQVDKRAADKLHADITKFADNRIRRAHAFALNKAAIELQKEQRAAVKQHLDRPTPFFLKGASLMTNIDLDGNAPLEIEIEPSEAVNPRLKYQILGGDREAGDVGPANTHVPIPNWNALQSSVARGAGVRITKNAYGNMPKTAYGRVMAAITRDKKKSPKKRSARLFMGVIEGVYGIWALPKYQRNDAEHDRGRSRRDGQHALQRTQRLARPAESEGFAGQSDGRHARDQDRGARRQIGRPADERRRRQRADRCGPRGP
ncbi:hypothetical protein GCM10008171_01610 [Methylopila jiangsuensis]|uniref:Uncharacterized protein n=1 Tax=Methylopila jiangsuensis TaxID=586230 RepID=A0A9W6N266_9HYPH|nr:hypothetical protein [Methylopila jiangsuensis]GLK74908.1 hypothetical protein GCM10008171_01610 [Methylopila jiangsuensis]